MKLKTYTVEIYDSARIAWAQQNPGMLSRRQRHQARVVPESHGAFPSILLTGRSLKRAQAEARTYTGRLVRIA